MIYEYAKVISEGILIILYLKEAKLSKISAISIIINLVHVCSHLKNYNIIFILLA